MGLIGDIYNRRKMDKIMQQEYKYGSNVYYPIDKVPDMPYPPHIDKNYAKRYKSDFRISWYKNVKEFTMDYERDAVQRWAFRDITLEQALVRLHYYRKDWKRIKEFFDMKEVMTLEDLRSGDIYLIYNGKWCEDDLEIMDELSQDVRFWDMVDWQERASRSR